MCMSLKTSGVVCLVFSIPLTLSGLLLDLVMEAYRYIYTDVYKVHVLV